MRALGAHSTARFYLAIAAPRDAWLCSALLRSLCFQNGKLAGAVKDMPGGARRSVKLLKQKLEWADGGAEAALRRADAEGRLPLHQLCRHHHDLTPAMLCLTRLPRDRNVTSGEGGGGVYY